jgi:hypothetical protein
MANDVTRIKQEKMRDERPESGFEGISGGRVDGNSVWVDGIAYGSGWDHKKKGEGEAGDEERRKEREGGERRGLCLDHGNDKANKMSSCFP